ncbi:hypothetical protein EW145_g1007 [Phellinidium pouzarii]|uniref:Uncharacterized protein n=1 Tax=Phellinidium pouzarii TaxID=167371 RepID=A0A4S4LGF3_9AGAM|nr:hypothetical protein EW145_g1007 [Phellinidium pouzarii]
MSDCDQTDCDSELDALGEDEDAQTMIKAIDGRSTSATLTSDFPKGDTGTCSLPPLEIISENLLLAVEKLHALSRTEGEIESSAEELHVCIGDVIQFVRAVASGSYIGSENSDYMKCLVSLCDHVFLSLFVDLRQRFLSSAMENTEFYHGDQAVICWIDFFFVYFADMILTISSGQQKANSLEDTLPYSIQKQKEEEKLRVACQLPHVWPNFPNILQSRHASPAVKRLALSILFAAYVIRPDIECCDPWSKSGIDPRHVLECVQVLLEEFTLQARSMTLSEKDPASSNLRNAYAMLIALNSSAELAAERLEVTGQYEPQFRPYTMAFFLELMQLILGPTDSVDDLILGELDDSQSILLHWSCTAPWTWARWDDPRILQFETVVKLTANWLCHVDKSMCITFWENQQPAREQNSLKISDNLSQVLQGAASLHPDATLIAFFHQVNNAKGILEASSASVRIVELNRRRLHRALWCLSELVLTCESTLSLETLSLVTEQVIEVFALLNPVTNGIETEDKAFISLEKSIPFFTKIAGVVGKASRMCTSDSVMPTPEDSLGLVAILDFISLICRSGAIKCLPVATTSFLSDLTGFLSLRVGSINLMIALLNCLTHVHSRCRLGKSPESANMEVGSSVTKLQKTWDDEDAYHLALAMSRMNFELASAFASYVTRTIKKGTDALLVAEAWDYFRDVLIIIATGRLDVDEQLNENPITLKIVAEKICRALEVLLGRCDANIARFLLQSPLTLSLIDVLQKPSRPPSFAYLRGSLDQETPQTNSNTDEFANVCRDFLKQLRKINSDLNKGSEDN